MKLRAVHGDAAMYHDVSGGPSQRLQAPPALPPKRGNSLKKRLLLNCPRHSNYIDICEIANDSLFQSLAIALALATQQCRTTPRHAAGPVLNSRTAVHLPLQCYLRAVAGRYAV